MSISGSPQEQRTPPESITATIPFRRQEFSFRLYRRRLCLGAAGVVHYYWMDGSEFRDPDSESGAANFRNVIGFWAAAMRQMSLGNELDQQINYVLAVCYGLVGQCKSLQSVYRDAYLGHQARRAAEDALPDEIRERIREIVQSRDRLRVETELNAALGRFEPPTKLLPLLQEAFTHWVGNGVALLRKDGNDGLERFLNETEYWLNKFRKRSKPWVRHFIDLFAYECKVAFYTCFANAWVEIIPWLVENQGLDRLSERFLRFWHNQNQSIEIPHGRTLGGIFYPTQCGMAFLEKSHSGDRVAHTISVQTEHIGPTHVKDVFSGQVLSLHPLSGVFMMDSAFCAIAGKFFASAAYEQTMKNGVSHFCGEYWDLIGAIMSAAHLYRRALDRQNSSRGKLTRTDAAPNAVASSDEPSQTTLLDDFAVSRGIKCRKCRGKLRSISHRLTETGQDLVVVNYTCEACQKNVQVPIRYSDLKEWLKPGE